jgi:putative oxidoreductase
LKAVCLFFSPAIGHTYRMFGHPFHAHALGISFRVTETVEAPLVVLGLAFRPVCILMVVNLIVAAVFIFELSGKISFMLSF